ncbi:hypothetical protein TAMA11512_01330 [Selenomonas sp. TAMA-11512]|uniref:3'-5' exonuclease n=1 Tax=Selenomonas sp. TAMA-11512 TaxID=3095337 RepID=UPI003091E701|nr:hypothetical protein TAMA11512_01330 [Selenomonas sp. TAMA-11512]
MLNSLFHHFDNIVTLDTETTGFSAFSEEIIEYGGVRLQKGAVSTKDTTDLNLLIRLSKGKRLPPKIVELTGITDAQLTSEGVDKKHAAEHIAAQLSGDRTLIVAYNAQFDLLFLYHFLKSFRLDICLRRAHFLDALTVYRDRRPYPHKLIDAIGAYGVDEENSHRATDDAKATVAVLDAMEREKPDLISYVDIFGYNPKFGAPKPHEAITRITYKPQDGRDVLPLWKK